MRSAIVQSVTGKVLEVGVTDDTSLVEIDVTCDVPEDITAVSIVDAVVIIGNDGFVKLSVVVQSKI